jgi:16S rRNA (uracil1498-N3)-methyltransferase
VFGEEAECRQDAPGDGLDGQTGECPPEADELRSERPELWTLSASESRHGARVLRLKPGDPVEVLGPDGMASAVVAKASRGPRPSLTVRITGPFARATDPVPAAVLGLAAVRPQAFEWAAARASELGCGILVPLATLRSRLSGPDPGPRLVRRARLAAHESRKQCGRSTLMEVSDPLTLAGFLVALDELAGLGSAGTGPDVGGTCPDISGSSPDVAAGGLVARTAPRVRIMADREGVPLLTALNLQEPRSPERPIARPVFLVGPEGGLAPEERDAALAAGFTAASLGPHTLKSETAAASVLAVFAAYALSLSFR